MLVEIREIVLRRRSVRKFAQRSVDREVLEELARYALLAPSGRNSKPVDLIIVTNRKVIDEIKNTRPAAFGFLETAPVCVVVVSNSESGTWHEDASIVATFVQLLAVDYGLGSCWGQAYNREHAGKPVDGEIKRILGVPERFNVLCVIGLGYPNEDKAPHNLSEVEASKIHWERW